MPRQLPRCATALVGRDVELAELNEVLDVPGGTALVCGTAGIGKTTLSLYWAHSVADRFPDGQLHVNLRGFDPVHPPMTSGEAVRGFLHGLGVPPERIPDSYDAQVGLYRSVTAVKQVLVVLDNARDVDQVRDLLPAGSRCAAVVTSRAELTGLIVLGVRRIGLSHLGSRDAKSLIAGRLGGPADASALSGLAAQCGGLPLALAVAAGRAAERTSFPLSALVAELRTERRRLDVLDTGDPGTTVRSVFSWSYQALSPSAQQMFRLLGATPGADIGFPAVVSLMGEAPGWTRGVLGELTRANLLEEHLPGRYRLHDLLSEYARECLVVDEQQLPVERLLDHYLHTTAAADRVLSPHRLRRDPLPPRPGAVVREPQDYESAVRWCVSEQHVLVGAVAHAARFGFHRHAWQLAWVTSTYLRRFSHHQDCEATQRVALASARAIGDQYAEAEISLLLGQTLVDAWRFTEAQSLHDRAVHLFNASGDAAAEAGSLMARCATHRVRGRHTAAESDIRRALALAEAVGDTNLRAGALSRISWNAVRLGNAAESIVYGAVALELFRQVGNQEGIALTRRAVGTAWHSLRRYDQAFAHYAASLELDVALGDGYYAAQVFFQIGLSHLALGRKREAIEAWCQATAVFEYLGRPEAGQVREALVKTVIMPGRFGREVRS
ncbi:tetratricopeptide repeat protein [Actinokineospora auranticolor]|nr:tetratricopeptide repeat protein [Actinokineospora auranticolor]